MQADRSGYVCGSVVPYRLADFTSGYFELGLEQRILAISLNQNCQDFTNSLGRYHATPTSWEERPRSYALYRYVHHTARL